MPPGIGQKIGGERPAHKDFAVGKVDHAQDAVDQGVPQGDQGIDAAQGDPVNGQVKPLPRAVLAGQEGLY